MDMYLTDYLKDWRLSMELYGGFPLNPIGMREELILAAISYHTSGQTMTTEVFSKTPFVMFLPMEKSCSVLRLTTCPWDFLKLLQDQMSCWR